MNHTQFTHLLAHSMLTDPRIDTAKKLLLDTIKEKQKNISTVEPPIENLKETYNEIISRFNEERGAPLWFPYIGSGIGHGPLVELLDGSIKYDFIGGIGVHFFGHSHPMLIDAALDAALLDLPMQGHLQQNSECITLSNLFVKASGLPHCFLSNSGAMALENGLKIAFQKKFPATRIFAFDHCFSGRTLALAQITDKASFRIGLPPTVTVDYVPFFDASAPQESLDRALSFIQAQIERYPKQHAAMIFELVQGEGGIYTGTTEFFTKIMKLLKENQIAIIMDEIQTFGRTPELFAYHYFNLKEYADICTVGKLSQICATLFTDEFVPQKGLLSQTFIGSTSSLKCSIAIMQHLLQSDLYGPKGKIQRFHDLFITKFEALAQRHPGTIKGPYGIGALIAFTPYNGIAEKTTEFVLSLFEEGLICFIAGSSPTRVRMLPPFGILKEKDVDEAFTILEKVLAKG